MPKYKALNSQVFFNENFKIVPIRYEDRYDIMIWRNEQIFHLRQNKPLTEHGQDDYFKNIITKGFELETPNQILFSFLENDTCIGYGGLVHINWVDLNAEISFIMKTSLEEMYFQKYWNIYIKLIEKVAFEDLGLNKISTYALDLRPKLYPIFENLGFEKEAVLRKHCLFNKEYINVVIHSKFNPELLIV
jgi:RimJ/RimL family protein N-acetyltransferase